MAAPQQYTHAEVKAGLFLAFCLALFCGMLLVYGHLSKFWRGRQELHVVFASAGGLSPDAPVLYNGVEVGRVKRMQIIHMDRQQLARLVPLVRSDLEHLPLSPEKCTELRLLPDDQFQEAAREALKDRTLIQLTLEVLQEGQLRRYLTDDTVVLQTTVLGDVTIEVISGPGHGQPISSDSQDKAPPLLVGISGDFFARLARSVEQVREVLSNVTDVVGAQERIAFKKASMRLGGILDKMDSLSDVANKRIDGTSKLFEDAGEQGRKDVEAIKKTLTDSGKDLDRVKTTFVDARKDLSARMTAFQDEASAVRKEFTAQGKAIAKNSDEAWDAAQPHLDEMKQHFRKLAESVMGVASMSDGIQYTAGRCMEQSEPDLAIFSRDLGRSAHNMRDERLVYWREKTGEYATKGENGEHEFYTALSTYRSLRRSTRWLADARAELDGLAPVVEGAGPEGLTTLPALQQARQATDQLQVGFADMRDAAALTLLPSFTGVTGQELVKPFERKCSGRQVWPKKL
jgi:ABC-type transporter Mla subunit MlaD